MKRFFTILAIVCAFAMVASSAFAYQEAFSTSAHRTQSRNAVVGSVDAAYYNPAGLTKLEDGLYVDVGNRVLGLTTTTEMESVNAESESVTTTFLLPNAAVAYKTGKSSLFLAMDIREGGAGGYWDDDDSKKVITASGLITAYDLANGEAIIDSIDATTYTFGYTAGGAFELNDMIAVAGGLRYLKKINDKDVKFTDYGKALGQEDVESHASWDGYQGFIGILVTPMDGLNVTAQYLGRSVKLANTEDAYNDSEASVSPSMLLLGVGYKVMPELEVMFSYNQEFTGAWDKGWDMDFPNEDGNIDKKVFGFGAEYTVMPGLIASAGLSYKMTGTADRNNTDPSDPSFDEVDLGAGAKYTVMPGLDVEGAVAYNYYMEAEDKDETQVHNRSAWVLGLGVTYKAM